jgi:arsenate reductase (thioredoxin)
MMENNIIKKSVLFLCTHNAVRSQMAEAFLNHLCGDLHSAFSAGSDPTRIDPLVVTVMKEIGIDVSANSSKNVSVFQGMHFDCVVTVCDQVQESCPYFSQGDIRIHKRFSDPSNFQGNAEDVIHEYRRVRDEIKAWVEKEFKQAMK